MDVGNPEVILAPLGGGHLDVWSGNRKLTQYLAMGFLDG
jgi:hypothetical protein